ncbi:MAG: peptidogalycan biosysnthesis protein, partial [Hyphomicrobiales bacterium]
MTPKSASSAATIDKITVEPSIAGIGQVAWDACAAPGGIAPRAHPPNPFITYDFLQALEETECVAPATGWLAQHLVARDASGQALAVMPCYLKSHSMGEYVFDHAWAQAFEAAGGDYYPKLQTCVPFTPVTGPRILCRPGVDTVTAIATLGAAARQLTRQHKASSLHITFALPDECAGLENAGFLHRTDRQFHWVNDGYADFDGFLAKLNSRKRKLIRRERGRALSDGITIEWLTGAAIEPRHWEAFFEFYLDTGSRKWGTPYLTREFFNLLGA